MSNIIVKIINEKRGSVEQFEYLNEKYKIKLISEKGEYKVKNSAFVNFNAQLVHRHIINFKFKQALLDMTAFIYGIPIIFIRNKIYFFRRYLRKTKKITKNSVLLDIIFN